MLANIYFLKICLAAELGHKYQNIVKLRQNSLKFIVDSLLFEKLHYSRVFLYKNIYFCGL